MRPGSWFRRHPRRLELMALHDGELTVGRAAEVEAHAQECARCRRWLADLDYVGAFVRGEVIPTDMPTPRWRPAPVFARLVPALAAVAAIALGMTLTEAPEPGGENVDVAATGNVENVPLPEVPASPSTPDRGPAPDDSPSQPAPSDPVRERPEDVDPGNTTPPRSSQPSAGDDPAGNGDSPQPIKLAVGVPQGQAGPGEAVVHAVATVLAEANQSGGIDGARLDLVVVDSNDPEMSEALREAGVSALVGGYAGTGAGYASPDETPIPWIAPADVAPSPVSDSVLMVEVDHETAGRMLGRYLGGDETTKAKVAAIAAPSPEAALVAGLSDEITVEHIPLSSSSCAPELETAAQSGADALALALPPSDVSRCLSFLTGAYPIREVVVPTTAVDSARAQTPQGLGLAAVLGAPTPDDDGPGATRFREATGIGDDYRALVSFAGAELAVELLGNDLSDPLGAFFAGDVYRSDLLTLDPGRTPHNVASQVIELQSSTSIEGPPDDYEFGNPPSGD